MTPELMVLFTVAFVGVLGALTWSAGGAVLLRGWCVIQITRADFGNVAIREAKIGMQETPIGTKGRAGIIEAQGDTSSTLIQAGGDDYGWCSRFPRTISGTTTSSRAGPESPAHCGQGMSDGDVGALVHMACGCGFLPAARLGNDYGR